MRNGSLALILAAFWAAPALACDPAYDATCGDDHQTQKQDAEHDHWREWPCRGPWFERRIYQEQEPDWYAERCS